MYHIPILSLLTLLTSFTLALPAPSAAAVAASSETNPVLSPNNGTAGLILIPTDSDDHPSCHGHSAKYIYFAHPLAPNLTFCITTAWHVRYPSQLRHALFRHGTAAATAASETEADPDADLTGFVAATPTGSNCGWITVDTVEKAGVERGEIGFRPTEGLDADTYEQPSERVVASIRHVLQRVYPWSEITLIVVFCLLPVWMPLGWMAWGKIAWVRAALKRRREEKKKMMKEGVKKVVVKVKGKGEVSETSSATTMVERERSG